MFFAFLFFLIVGSFDFLYSRISPYIVRGEKWIKRALLFIAFACIGLLYYPDIGDIGEMAFEVLYIILFIPILSRVFGLSLAKIFMGYRRELGILMGMLALAHTGNYMLMAGFSSLASPSFWWSSSRLTYTAFGFCAFTLSTLLLLTSNVWSQKSFPRAWKALHRLVYVLLWLIVAHVIFIKGWKAGQIPWGELMLPIVYFFFKILEWASISISFHRGGAIKTFEKIGKGQKYICVPCGYIYDPLVGDTDSGIAPGTEFSDIPDDWRCPVCGVSKIDFIPYEDSVSSAGATVVDIQKLNPTTLEFTLELSSSVSVQPGQFGKVILRDHDGDFNRSYSVVRKNGNKLTFTVKLTSGRGSRVLQNMKKGDVVGFGGIFGNFIVKNTLSPKVFIATGTGLSPIIHMLENTAPGVSKTVFFSVSKKDELFYEDILASIPNTTTIISLSREEVPGYLFGRIDLSHDFARETEFYLCGNPAMVQEKKRELTDRGYVHVFTEVFF